jgi:copper chaperone CopZ
LRAIWILAGTAMLLAFALVVVRPWASCAPRSSDTGLQKARTAGTRTVSIPVEGMSCMVCVSSVKRAAQGIDGVRDAEVDLAGKRAKISYVEGTTSPEQIAAAIARLGYKTGPPVVEKGQ